MAVKIGSARIDENGKAHGGRAGDQTGKELSTQSWYLHSKGWRVFRAKSAEAAEKIARCMEAACQNANIGYDQYERSSLYKVAAPLGFDAAKVTTPCETDCSALVRVCCAFAGIMDLPEGFRTTNEPNYLLKTGAFVELTGSKYQGQSQYLGRGDILCTKTQGHTVVVLTSGSKYEGSVEAREYALGERVLRHGCAGADVRQMQEMLIELDYDLGKYGADGDFGDCTELALKAFQAAAGIGADGECGPITVKALTLAVEYMAEADACADACPIFVVIEGGDCYIRTAPNTDGGILGVAHRGDKLPYGGAVSENGWPMVEYNGQNAWVSGKYGRLDSGIRHEALGTSSSADDSDPPARGEKIVDISKWQADVDFDALIADTALIILRAGYRGSDGGVKIDERFVHNAGALRARGVRFGVYFYSIATNESMAREEARMFWKWAKDYAPLFWALDAEKSEITQDAIAAFVDELRKLGADRVGCYVAHHLCRKYRYDELRAAFDFTWIPRYGKNTGAIEGSMKPDFECDLWQYTSTGTVSGISGNVDLNVITGSGRTLEWFVGGEG